MEKRLCDTRMSSGKCYLHSIRLERLSLNNNEYRIIFPWKQLLAWNCRVTIEQESNNKPTTAPLTETQNANSEYFKSILKLNRI